MDELHIKGFLCFYGEISRCSSALHTKQSDCWMDGRIGWETVVKHWTGTILSVHKIKILIQVQTHKCSHYDIYIFNI